MAKYSNTGTRIYIDEYDISGFLNATNLDIKQETAPVTTFSDTGPRRVVGNYDHSGGYTGFIDTADNSFDEIAFNQILTDGAEHYIMRLHGINTEGSVAYEVLAVPSGQSRKAAIGAAHIIDMTDEGSNGVARSLLIRTGTITANGNGTGYNVGASTLNQTFQIVIRVISGTFTSFDVKVQESTDDGAGDAYADVSGLAQTGISAAGVWRKTTTAATEAWKRVVIANWNGTSAVLLVTAGIVKGT